MAYMPHVVVVTHDNTDPSVYGPYDNLQEAQLAIAPIRAELARHGSDRHVESMTPRPLKR